MRALPVLCALLVVGVAVGGAATMPAVQPERSPTPASDDPAVTPATPTAADVDATVAANATPRVNVSRILVLPASGASTTTIQRITLDAGVAVSFGANASAARMETLSLRRTILSAETSDARSQAILEGTNEVEQRAVTLRTSYRTTVSAYATGDLTATELVVELARISAEAHALADRIRMLVRLAEEIEGFSLESGRVQPLLFDLDTFGGPVTERAVASLRGDGEPTRMFVSAAGASVALTTVTDDEYVREVYRADLRELDGSAIRPAVAQDVTARSYPEIWAARTATSGAGEGGTFVYGVAYPSGRLTAFIDGGTERVFKEYQRVNLTTFSGGPVANDTQNGLTLRVNRTYAGGPLRVSLVDAETGEPVDATVRLGSGGDSVTVGRTGDDGVLWTLSPDEQYQVTAVQVDTASAAFVDDVSPVDPETVAEAYGGNATTGNRAASSPAESAPA